MARSLRPVVDLRVTKNPEPAEDPAPSPIVWPNALAPSSSSTPPPSRPAIHRSADRRATAAMGFHRAAITRKGSFIVFIVDPRRIGFRGVGFGPSVDLELPPARH
jgi:hypothetical protein